MVMQDLNSKVSNPEASPSASQASDPEISSSVPQMLVQNDPTSSGPNAMPKPTNSKSGPGLGVYICLVVGIINTIFTLLSFYDAFFVSHGMVGAAILWGFAIVSFVFFIPVSSVVAGICFIKSKAFRNQKNDFAYKMSIAAAIIGIVPVAGILLLILYGLGYFAFSNTIGVSLQERDPYTATGLVDTRTLCEGIHSSTLAPDTSLGVRDYATGIACAYAMSLHDNSVEPTTESAIKHYLPNGFLENAFEGKVARITIKAEQPTEPYIFNVVPGQHCREENLGGVAISVWYRDIENSRRNCSELVFYDVDPLEDPAGSWYSATFRDYPHAGWLEYSNKV